MRAVNREHEQPRERPRRAALAVPPWPGHLAGASPTTFLKDFVLNSDRVCEKGHFQNMLSGNMHTKICEQSGASYLSQGFEDYVLKSPPG